MPSNNKKRLFMAILCCLTPLSALATQSISYTYNSFGQIETIDGPRTDVSDITSITYYAGLFEFASGNINGVTNALGHLIQFRSYNGRGQFQEVIDANGVSTKLSYHARGWLSEIKIEDPDRSRREDAITKITYSAAGEVTQLTLPNGARLIFEYDEARRLQSIENGLGERIEYGYDAAGNRVSEDIRANGGPIKKSLSRFFDELNRLIRVVESNGQTSLYSYDLNNNNTSMVNGRNKTTHWQYDALNRVSTIIDADNSQVTQNHDSLDRLIQLNDPRDLPTSYQFDVYNNLSQINSPDTGQTEFGYDDAGNLISRHGAEGLLTLYSYDALNRVSAISYPDDSSRNIQYIYDDTTGGNFGIGRVTQIQDASGITQYQYDHRGNVIAKTSTRGNYSHTLEYTYDLADMLTQTRYPSGRVVQHNRDTQGRIASLSTTSNQASPTLDVVSDVTYLPFGPIEFWRYGSSLELSRTFDQDYRLNTQQLSGTSSLWDKSLGYDNANNIIDITDILTPNDNQSFAYDNLNRLIEGTGYYGNLLYNYDASGNRLLKMLDTGSSTIIQDYIYDTGSNRLLSVDDGNAIRLFDYNLSGSIIKDKTGSENGLILNYDANRQLNSLVSEGEN